MARTIPRRIARPRVRQPRRRARLGLRRESDCIATSFILRVSGAVRRVCEAGSHWKFPLTLLIEKQRRARCGSATEVFRKRLDLD
jgi:hypothetical protein